MVQGRLCNVWVLLPEIDFRKSEEIVLPNPMYLLQNQKVTESCFLKGFPFFPKNFSNTAL